MGESWRDVSCACGKWLCLTSCCSYLVLEYVENGELFGYIMEHGRLPEVEAIRIFRQIIAGLEHCHFYNLCHRDLKPENILMDSENNVKIADFGMASVQHSRWLRTSCGSPHYAAPEVVSGGKYDGERADIWSAGVVFYVMLVGRQPFGSECEMGDPATRDAQLKEILRQVVSAEVALPSWISDEAEDLIVRILDPNPRSRITIKGIWEHRLLRKYEGHARREGWLGDPQLNVSKKDCGGPIPNQQMDMDVIASLCMLWHTTSEQTIIKKLCSPE
jgi:serine/threonine-protein kinase HSL1, negative regulator of Swe1 kinase